MWRMLCVDLYSALIPEGLFLPFFYALNINSNMKCVMVL